MAKGIKYDDSGLKDLTTALKKEYFVRVGIIGSKALKVEHKNSKLTNAELGTIHEFGGKSKHGKDQPPRRSFLEDSLKFKLDLSAEKLKFLKKSLFKNLFEKGAPQQFLEELGSVCLQIIGTAFATNGFGMWKPLSMRYFEKRLDKAFKNYHRIEGQMYRGTIKYDKAMLDDYLKEIHNPSILTDTGALRKSISFKVMRKK